MKKVLGMVLFLAVAQTSFADGRTDRENRQALQNDSGDTSIYNNSTSEMEIENLKALRGRLGKGAETKVDRIYIQKLLEREQLRRGDSKGTEANGGGGLVTTNKNGKTRIMILDENGHEQKMTREEADRISEDFVKDLRAKDVPYADMIKRKKMELLLENNK